MSVVTIKEKIMDALETFWNYLSQIVVKYDDVVNNLTSTDTNLPLSAAQGKVLGDKLDVIGTSSTAGWTASSSSAASTALTGTISLTKGAYIVIGLIPAVTGGPIMTALAGANITRPFKTYHMIDSYGVFIEYIQGHTTTGSYIYLQTEASTPVTFSETQRGLLTAIRIG